MRAKRASTVRSLLIRLRHLGTSFALSAMANNLQKYWTKRNFAIHAEPKGIVDAPESR